MLPKKEYFMKTRQTILCGFLAVILALTFTACGGGGHDDDDGKGGNSNTGGSSGGLTDKDWKWTVVEDRSIWEYTSSKGTAYTADIHAIAYGNGKWVSGGAKGKMAYSTDNGIKWTAVEDSTFGTDSIYAIAYGNGRWVAGGENGKMAYSDDDGESWTAVEVKSVAYICKAIAYGNKRFVAGGTNGRQYSTDGETWTGSVIKVGTITINISDIAYGNNMFVAVGPQGKMMYSDDGESWTPNSFEDTSVTLGFVGYGNNRFVCKEAYSTDGITWTTKGKARPRPGNAIAFGNNRFVAVGNGTVSNVFYSANGESWTAVTDSAVTAKINSSSSNEINDIAYGKADGASVGRFVAVGDEGKILYADW